MEGFTSKTTRLEGRVDVGPAGIRQFGVLWAVAAVGLVAGVAAPAASSPGCTPPERGATGGGGCTGVYFMY